MTNDQAITYFDDFRGPNKHAFLSNFYVSPIVIREVTYETGEHAFQAYKASTNADRTRVWSAKTPGEAKQIGRTIELRSDWELVKYDVMRMVLHWKFRPGTSLSAKLLDTGDRMLVEGTDWNDRVWGVSNTNGVGRNWLGCLLMARRAELRAGYEPLVGQAMKMIRPPWRS